MRIVINYLLTAKMGGARTYLETIVPRIAESSQHSFLLLLLQGVTSPNLPENVIVRHTPKWVVDVSTAIIWESLFLWAFIKDWKPDVIYKPTHCGMKVKQCPTVLAMRNMFIPLSASRRLPLKRWLRYLVLRNIVPRFLIKADYVVAVSNFVREYLCDQLNIEENRVFTIPHGFDPRYRSMPFSGKLQIGNADITDSFIFAPGGYSEYQRPELIVKAFCMLLSNGYELSLVMTGPRISAHFLQWMKEAEHYGLSRNRIICLENIDVQHMVSLFNRAQISCFASEVEACPNALVEAMGSGAVILAPDCKPFPEFIEDAGVIYKSGDYRDFARSMSHLLENPALRRLLREKALKRSEDFTATACAQRTLEMLELIVSVGNTIPKLVNVANLPLYSIPRD